MGRWLALMLLAAACQAPLAQRLDDACAARVCPSDPPRYIDCMPPIATDWEKICGECQAFLSGTCHIQYVE